MCDTFAFVSKTASPLVVLGKNSDREPGEAQVVEVYTPSSSSPASSKRPSLLPTSSPPQGLTVAISRPFWMWGAEMGVNSAGLAIGNEAVFTKLPVEKDGLTGMDLLRFALEETTSAKDALECLTDLLARVPQGGRGGYRSKGMRYHNSFLLADTTEVWHLETAGSFWAARPLDQGFLAISNVLSIHKDGQRLGPGTFEFAKKKGWCHSAHDFSWAEAFGSRLYRPLTGGDLRRACLHRSLGAIRSPDPSAFFSALRDHGGHDPRDGWRMQAPCAHASWWPTRAAAQTTGSMLAMLTPPTQERSPRDTRDTRDARDAYDAAPRDACGTRSENSRDAADTRSPNSRDAVGTPGSNPRDAADTRVWFTGTSSPCLSVFKPVSLERHEEPWREGPEAKGGYDPESLFWRHERLHRLVLRQPQELSRMIRLHLDPLEKSGLSNEADKRALWAEHRALLPALVEEILPSVPKPSFWPSDLYWKRQNKHDHFPRTG